MADAGRLFEADSGSLVIDSADESTNVKEISISGGERGLDLVRTFNGGEWEDFKPINTPIEVQLTMVTRDTDPFAYVLGGRLTSSTGSALHVNQPTVRKLQYDWYDPSSGNGPQIRFEFGSAYAISNDARMNTEDFMENTLTFRCAPKNVKYQYTDDRVASAIS